MIPGRTRLQFATSSVCAGDGVIPAWSARLISALPQNVRTVRGKIEDGFEHMDLLSLPSIQAELSSIMWS